MKALKDMTDTELVALDDKQIQRYIDIECAESGVPMLPPAPEFPDKPKYKPDSKIYALKNGYSVLANFSTMKEAQSVLEAVEKTVLMEDGYFGGGYSNRKAFPAKRELEVASVDVFSAGQADKIKDEFSTYEELKKTADAAQKDYKTASDARSEISEAIKEPIYEASRREQKRDVIAAAWIKYLDLAEGSKDVALNFLKKSYSDVNDLFPAETGGKQQLAIAERLVAIEDEEA